MNEIPRFLRPFVAEHPDLPSPVAVAPNLDLYLPDAVSGPHPVVLLVHGGPIPDDFAPTPRAWPVYIGYAALLRAAGVAAAVVDHRYHVVDGPDGPTVDAVTAAADVAAAVEALRAHPDVAGDRVVLWAFSGAGLLCADWLRDRPAWLRAIFLSYPLLASPAPHLPAEDRLHLDPRFAPIDAVAGAGADAPPIVLTRAGRERPLLAGFVAAFVAAAAAAPLEIIDVPDGQHSFDVLDDTGESRAALHAAVARAVAVLEDGH
ncbi:alpha/beta hydrolase [Asanoa sp. WMMD1127]|uniref:alpha/beta hydrolase n=1 Tax=Asanoa sp. WMMD1127 TaxID=3016107 RepID=UPI002415B321|nr:alpha/beta hydrolase [Asanoa sp. WMMD1127]MDG4826115.1 alpha/beta hydrolase [Asanoa sp. WMMD1127]